MFDLPAQILFFFNVNAWNLSSGKFKGILGRSRQSLNSSPGDCNMETGRRETSESWLWFRHRPPDIWVHLVSTSWQGEVRSPLWNLPVEVYNKWHTIPPLKAAFQYLKASIPPPTAEAMRRRLRRVCSQSHQDTSTHPKRRGLGKKMHPLIF